MRPDLAVRDLRAQRFVHELDRVFDREHVAGARLVDVIAPQLTGRTSGHVRVERTRIRVGDGAEMATIAFVDEIKETPVAVAPAEVKA